MTAGTETLRTCRGPELPDVFRWQATAFIRTQWPTVGGGAVRETYPVELEPLHVVLADGDLLLGYAGIVRLRLPHDGQDWLVDALGRVFTFPGARGSGRGRRLVDAATDAVRTGGADLGALLCEPSLRPFYASSGWTAVGPGVLISAGSGAPAFPVPGPTMLLAVSARARASWSSFEQVPLSVPFAW